MTKNEKPFDCIAMKSSIQRQIYNETKNMTVNDLLHYFNGNNKSKKVSTKKSRLNTPVQQGV